MNFIRIFQLSTLIILEICSTMIKAQEANCDIEPTGQDLVNVLVYINGGTTFDDLWYQRYCSWLGGNFPYDQYTPITVKVGGDVTCDEDNNCNCPNEESDTVDCTTTFQYVCIEQSLGQEEFLKFLCCLVTFANGSTLPVKDYQTCVDERPGLADKISDCMENDDSDEGPQEIALQNSQQVVDAGVDMSCNTEPFFFYNGIFDECISADSPGFWLQKLCAMLKYDIAVNLSQCKKAMGWS